MSLKLVKYFENMSQVKEVDIEIESGDISTEDTLNETIDSQNSVEVDLKQSNGAQRTVKNYDSCGRTIPTSNNLYNIVLSSPKDQSRDSRKEDANRILTDEVKLCFLHIVHSFICT